ncbi:uro-adherence factor A isoform X3 [Drosophila takahashii]
MENLDLAGYHDTTIRNWTSLGAFEQQEDAAYLSSSRQILEPIMEETSEDEELAQSRWSDCQEHRSTLLNSTESETGSVLRIEVINDVDGMSERDYACPPKRPRRSLETDSGQSLEDSVQLRRPLLPDPETSVSLETCVRDNCGSQSQRSSSGSRRGGSFEDFYSDNDSYHSLSRSSSLVQFESLERQFTLQEIHQSLNSLGNSSPSLSFEVNATSRTTNSNPESRKGSATSLSLIKRFESNDCSRLHQTYYELNKLTFENQRDMFSESLHQEQLIFDSENSSNSSSSSSSDSSGHSLLSSRLVSGGAGRTRTGTGRQDGTAPRRMPPSSAENLSEDSGYCEPRTLQQEKTTSIPKNFEKLCEEEEELLLLEENSPHSRNFTGIHDLCQPKIEQTISTVATPCSPSTINSSPERACSQSESTSPLPSPSGSTLTSSAASFTWLSNSLPDIRESRGPFTVGIINTESKYVANGNVLATTSKNSSSNVRRSRSSSSVESCDGSSLLVATHSLNELQQFGRRRRSRHIPHNYRNCHSNSSASSSSEELDLEREERRDDFFLDCHSLSRNRRSFSWSDRAKRAVGVASAGYLNASYQNLTLLDYSDKLPSVDRLQKNLKRIQAEVMSDQSSVDARNYEQIICKGNFLLDEISKIYDKNVSILTDKPDLEEQPTPPDGCDSNSPKKVLQVQLTVRAPPRQKRPTQEQQVNLSRNSIVKTFDQDPTNLRTSYAQSLEQYHFEVREATDTATPQRSLPKRRFQSQFQKSFGKQRSFVNSTPNLSVCDDGRREPEDDIYVSSAHTSMHHLPQMPTQSKPLGILLPAGSRHSFGKEVSFCPVVSKYCWQEQTSEEPPEDQSHFSEAEFGPSSDDELLDDSDATVMHNTKENENIAALFEQEIVQSLKEHPTTQEYTTLPTTPLSTMPTYASNLNLVFKESVGSKNKDSFAALDSRNQKAEDGVDPNHELEISSPVSHERHAVANSSIDEAPHSAATYAAAKLRPLTLPILNKPPTNRAHNILYASQHLLQRYEPEDRQIHKMPLASAISTVDRADDKHPGSRGFLSKFAHGLRFSLRRKKKEQRDQMQSVVVKVSPGKESRQITGKGRWADFVHISVKPPRIPTFIQLDDSVPSEASSANVHCSQQSEKLDQSSTQKKVTGKPPLPKLPPRSGILAHAPQDAASGTVSAAHGTEALISTKREQYKQFPDQLTAGIQASRMRDRESTPLAYVSQNTHMFNQSGENGHVSGPTVVTAVPVDVSPMKEIGKMGLIETNLDTQETVISGTTRSLMDITGHPLSLPHKRYIVKRLNTTSDNNVNEIDGQAVKSSLGGCGVQLASFRRPHKSMEFLLDKENQKNVLPPENELQKSHDHNPAVLSEHQLRVQASLQRLNIPDWFRHYNKETVKVADGDNVTTKSNSGGYRPGHFTRMRTQDSGRWQGLNSKTTSLSSLGSQRFDRSPLLMSPSAHSHHGGQSIYACGPTKGHGPASAQTGVGATRWSTSHLNSFQTSPSVSQRGSFARGAPINSSFLSVASSSGVLRNSYRQPYLGWRSTEKLSQRTPHERLANSLLVQRATPSPTCASNGAWTVHSVTPEIQSSIKEVTSAIVHYVNDQQQSQHPHSRLASPNSR